MRHQSIFVLNLDKLIEVLQMSVQHLQIALTCIVIVLSKKGLCLKFLMKYLCQEKY